MVAQFPIPVLSVAADAVRDLQGSEALSGLWTLFTKCKESLHDGRRLENISWRLWYREMMLRNLEREEVFSNEKEKHLDDDLADTIFDEKSSYLPPVSLLSPPTSVRTSHESGAHPLMSPHQSRLSAGSASPAPSSSPIPFPSSPRRAHSPLLSPAIPENNRPLLNSSNRRNSFRAGTPINVGQIIYDMLPSPSLTNGSNNVVANALISNGPNLSRRTSATSSSMFENVPSGSSNSSPHSGLLDERPNKFKIHELPSHIIPSNNLSFLPTPELELEVNLDALSLNQITSAENKASPSQSEIPKSIILQSLSTQTVPTDNEILTRGTRTDNDSNAEQSYLPVSLKPYTGPPSPSLSDSYAHAHPGEVEVKEVGLLASLSTTNNSGQAEQRPESSNSPSAPSITTMFAPSSAGSLVEPPKVVVVNPTPNLTPHPTPPATPLIHGVIGPGGVFKSHFLTLPEGSAGARQHQILEAYHQQQQLLGSHFTTLHLPPSHSSGTGADLGGVGSYATRATSGPSNANWDQHDRSRSVSMGDPETSETSGSTDGVISKQGGSGDRNSLGHNQHQQQSQQRHRQGQGQLQLRASDDSGRYPTALAPDADRQTSGTRDKTNRNSISSIASNQSQLTTASEQSSVSGGIAESSTTTSPTSTGNLKLDSIHAKQDSMDMAQVHAQVNTYAPTRVLDPLHTKSTLVDKKNDDAGRGHTSAKNGDLADENADEDDIPLSPLPSYSPGARSTSSRSDKRAKRNSAPVPTTTTPSAMFALSPTHSTGSTQPYLNSSPGSINDHLQGKKVPAPGGLVRRASSTSRSGASSLGKSRSRSREVGIGLGGFNMTTVAAPTAAPTRKVGGGRGRSKVVFNRAGAKGKGIARRNSAGTTAAAVDDPDAMEQELEQERLEREYEEQVRAEELEKERRRLEAQAMEARGAAEKAAVYGAIRTNAAQPDSVGEGVAEGSKRPNTRFNIGSNSDGSKSVGSVSDVSPAQQADGNHERTREKSSSKGKGKERADERTQEKQLTNRRDQVDQSEQQGRLVNGHQNLQEQLQRRMSGPQLRQLQAMEQLLRQQNPTALQQQLQPQQQGLQNLLLSSGQGSTAQAKASGSVEKGAVEKVTKGKGKGKEVVKKLKNSHKGTTIIFDEKIVKQHIAAPLLPQNKRTIVLATTSESEFETDSDDGSWSDASGDAKHKEKVASANESTSRAPIQQVQQEQPRPQQQQPRPQEAQPPRQRQQGHARQQSQQHQAQAKQQHHHQPARPTGVQRTQSSHYPAANNGRANKTSRAQQQQRQAQLDAQAVERAALEAQRYREMFVKLPTTSFQDLAKARTKSGLSILMNPNPEIFPINHPYRRGFSSGDIRPGGISGLTAMAPLRPAAADPPPPPAEQSDSKRVAENIAPKPREPSNKGTGKARVGSNITSAIRPIALQRAKSSAAMPISSQIVAGSTGMKAPAVIDMTSAAVLSNVQPKAFGSSGYRPKGPPQGAELEDDSGSEEPNNKLPLSNSVAQEKLKAFAQRSRIQPNTHRSPIVEQTETRAGEDDVPQWAKVSNTVAQPQNRNRNPSRANTMPEALPQPPVPAPIPVNQFVYPYTLPIEAAPTTPRTTRRNMLSTEIPESLRRDVFWAHKIEREETIGAARRNASSGGNRHSVLGNGLRPLTAVPSVVQLHAKGTGPPGSSMKDDHPLGRRPLSGKPKEEKRQDGVARNKSWAHDYDYHCSGW